MLAKQRFLEDRHNHIHLPEHHHKICLAMSHKKNVILSLFESKKCVYVSAPMVPVVMSYGPGNLMSFILAL